MKKLTSYLILLAFIASCSKETKKPLLYDEQFSISFKLDGKEYKNVLAPDIMNYYGSSGLHNGPQITYMLGAGFQLDADKSIDATLEDAVQISLIDDPKGVNLWSTTKMKLVGSVATDVEVDQAGSAFIITEVKESTTNGINKNAIVVKGIFHCTLHEPNTGNEKLLTDAMFTCIIPVL